MPQERGKFIVLEGSDGSGKATQQKLLVKRIRKELKLKTCELDFPQYSNNIFGELAGRYLAGEFGGLKNTNPYLTSLSFAGDRWQAKAKINRALEKGKIVVSNRYVLSNMAHQAAKLPKIEREKFLVFLAKLEYKIYKVVKEDLNIFLHVPARIGQRLVDGRGKKRDIHEGDIKYLKESTEMYEYLAEKYKNKIVFLECCYENGSLKPIEEIHDMV